MLSQNVREIELQLEIIDCGNAERLSDWNGNISASAR